MKQMKTLRKKRMPPLAQSVLIFSAVFFLLAILESNQFLSAKNLLSILKFATFPGVLTIGLAFVILSGQIDLSCGMLMGLVSVLLTYFVLADIGVVWAVLLAVGIGTLCGLLNGVLTVCLKLPAFIVTIGTQQIFSGLAYLVFNSPQKVFTDPNLQKIGKISIGCFGTGSVRTAPVEWFSLSLAPGSAAAANPGYLLSDAQYDPAGRNLPAGFSICYDTRGSAILQAEFRP